VSSNPSSPSETAGAAVVPGGLVSPRAEKSTRRPVTSDQSGPDSPGGGPAGAGGPAATTVSGERLIAYWLSPPGLVMLGATVTALILRLFLLSRPGHLTGVTEYDDGVYLGGAIRLLQGALPYHDFAFVQPPGIMLLMTPVALLATIGSTTHAMAAARLLTVLASTAAVPLTGSLVRYRGVFVTLVTCGLLAVYPDDISTAHTLILEPWLNLLMLTGCCLAFRRGRLATPRRLLWAGVAFGLAGTVKYWAALPAAGLLAVCLLSRSRPGAQSGGTGGRPPGRQLAWRYTVGVAAGFTLPVLPFLAAGPGLYIRSTLLDQAVRTGTWVSPALRLAHITGLIDFLNAQGQLTLRAGARSLFTNTPTVTPSVGWLPFVVTALLVAVLGLGYIWVPGRPSPLEWYVLGTFAAVMVALLGYSAFFYHYADFTVPWLAMSAGCAAGTLCGRFVGRQRVRQGLIAAAAVLIAAVSVFQVSEMAGLHGTSVYPDRKLIPPGACVVSDEVSLTIAANRFTASRPGCPDVLDSLATTLVEGNGISVQGGAKALPRVVSEWRKVFSRAQYVWLSQNSGRRIPWTPGLWRWFARHFRAIEPHGHARGLGVVYVRVQPASPAPGDAAARTRSRSGP
jgi:alpha-1,2-mannosyltransferase